MDAPDDIASRIRSLLQQATPTASRAELQDKLARALAFAARIEDGERAANDSDGGEGDVQIEAPIAPISSMTPHFRLNWRADDLVHKSLCSNSFPAHPSSSHVLIQVPPHTACTGRHTSSQPLRR